MDVQEVSVNVQIAPARAAVGVGTQAANGAKRAIMASLHVLNILSFVLHIRENLV